MMNTARKSDSSGALNSAANLTSDMAANAADYASRTKSAFGRELQNLRENDWNFDYTVKSDKKD